MTALMLLSQVSSCNEIFACLHGLESSSRVTGFEPVFCIPVNFLKVKDSKSVLCYLICVKMGNLGSKETQVLCENGALKAIIFFQSFMNSLKMFTSTSVFKGKLNIFIVLQCVCK